MHRVAPSYEQVSDSAIVEDFDTRAVHAGRRDLRAMGAHVPPLDFSTTYPLSDLAQAGESLEMLAQGAARADCAVYARLFNPTTDRFEQAMAELEGGEDGVAFASGMAALTACLMAARERGDHVVAIRPLYGGSDHLLASQMTGLKVDFVEPADLADAIRPGTALVIAETPANPTLRLLDVARLVKDAQGVPVLVDNTFATPVLQNPMAQGASMVLHSATKYLGGHGDVVGGVVVARGEHGASLRRVRVATGALLHPMGAYMLHRGLQTLGLRMRAQQQSAQLLAQRLVEHAGVERVHFPGFRACDPEGLVGRQMRGPGAMVAFELKGDQATAARVMQAVQLMTPAVSLGSVDTLIQHPASLTHRPLSEEVRQKSGVSPTLLRMSVGLENPEDLWRDLCRAMDIARQG